MAHSAQLRHCSRLPARGTRAAQQLRGHSSLREPVVRRGHVVLASSSPAAAAAATAAAAAAGPHHHQQQQQRNLLLAVDDTDASTHALAWACQHLHRPGGSDCVKLVHVEPVLPAGRLVAVPGGLLRVPHVEPALLEEQAQAQRSALQQRLLAQLEAAGVPGATFEVLRGPPTGSAKASISAALCERAAQDGAAAVVIASSSRGGLAEALKGSIAASLAQQCAVPVVVLHPPQAPQPAAAAASATQQARPGSGVATWLWRATDDVLAAAGTSGGGTQQQQQPGARNLVVAVDDSDEGFAAVQWVLEQLLRPDSDTLHVLHVVPALPAHMSYSLAPDGMLYSLPLPQLEEAEVEEEHWRELLMARLGPLLQAHSGVRYQLDVVTDYGTDALAGIAAAVVSRAEALGAAALVVSGHRKAGLAEWLLGSVSDYAVHHAQVPVVVLHAGGGGGGGPELAE